MKNKYNKLTCLFGHHDYSQKLTKDKHGFYGHLCKTCKQSGYRKWQDETEVWKDYDGEGNCIHTKWNDGDEVWCEYDEKGRRVYDKDQGGDENWYNKNGTIIHKKYSDGYEVWFGRDGSPTHSSDQKN